MLILAAPLTYLVFTLMTVGIGHDLSTAKDATAQQVPSGSQSRDEAATADVVAQ
ncbi:hypothetical protein [Aquitalea sp.]|uniref:hypothetical protein n=1 Tax=Aquitalea sp. TaxID=1872623 RepID=UPI00259074CE|nr:hypothetical protein [Aquitalea sp.]